MSAGPTTSAACATMGAGCAMATAPAAADRRGGAFGRDPAGARGGGAVRLEAVPALDEAASHPAPGGDGRGSVRSRALDARRRGALRGGGARQALEVERVEDLWRAPRAPRGLQAPRPLPAEARGALTRCDLPQRQTQGPEGGRALRLGLHRGRGAGPGRGPPGDARVARGLARPGRDLIARGLQAPMLIVADGAPGLIKAAEQCWPASDRQHCSVHRARNLIAKLPEAERERVRRAYWAALDEAKDEGDAKQQLEALVAELERAGFASAARCLADDLDALVVHLRYPPRHRKRWRSTNLLERTLGEVKRRTKVIGRFPGEESCLSLVWAVLDLRINNACNGSRSRRSTASASTGSATSRADQRPNGRRWSPLRLTPREPKPRRSYSSFGTPPQPRGGFRQGRTGGVPAGTRLATALEIKQLPRRR